MCDDCEWQDYLEMAEELADRGSGYAESVAHWISEHAHVTEMQQAALERTLETFNARQGDS